MKKWKKGGMDGFSETRWINIVKGEWMASLTTQTRTQHWGRGLNTGDED